MDETQKRSCEELTFAICKQAAQLAFKDKNIVENDEGMKNGDIYITYIGTLWQKSSHNSKLHQIYVKLAYFTDSAKLILVNEEHTRDKKRKEKTGKHESKSIASSYLSGIKNSWKEVEYAYKAMLRESHSEKSAHDKAILSDLEQYAAALEAARKSIQNPVRNWEELAFSICKVAAQMAYKDKNVVESIDEKEEEDIYITEVGTLWRSKPRDTNLHQTFVNPVYFIKSAKQILDEEEHIRYKERENRTSVQEAKGMASGFLSNVKNTWKEVEYAYKMMLQYSRTENSGYEKAILADLEEYANALKAACDNLQDFNSGYKRRSSKDNSIVHYHFCPLCWRLVFQNSSKYSGNERCSMHQDTQSKEYKEKLKLKNYVKPENRISERAKIKYEKIGHPEEYAKEDYLPERYARLRSEFWIELKRINEKVAEFRKQEFHEQKLTVNVENDIEILYPTTSFDPQSVPVQPVELGKLWKLFDKAAIYAHYNGADLNDLGSVLATLDDKGDRTGMRQKIHTAYTRAPMLALGFLSNVEVWRELRIKKRLRGK